MSLIASFIAVNTRNVRHALTSMDAGSFRIYGDATRLRTNVVGALQTIKTERENYSLRKNVLPLEGLPMHERFGFIASGT